MNHFPESGDPMLPQLTDLVFTENNDLEIDILERVCLPGNQFLPSPESETLDIALKTYQETNIPVSPIGRPHSDSYPGKYHFVVEVNSEHVHRKKFMYSHLLNRIYVDMNSNFSVQFNWDHVPALEMYVRATTIFSDETQAEKRVVKCLQHYQESINEGHREQIARNVLHSSRPFDADGVYYCGHAEKEDSWYSVLVKMDRENSQHVTHAYKFTCKNSCTTGINRRAIAIVFTLEDMFGTVYGRQRIGTRVCSCPKRDMNKDEECEGVYKNGKKRVPSNQIQPTPKPKRIKLEATDDYITLPPLPVVDVRTMEAGLEVMLKMMQQGLEHNQQDPHEHQKYTHCVTTFQQALKDIKTVVPPQ